MEEDIKLLLSYIETEVREGKRPLVGGGVVVNGAQILSLLDRIRAALDVATGENVIREATQKANEIIELAQERKQKLIDEDIATMEAKARAERIVKQALVERSKIENDLRDNLNYLLETVKSTMEKANDDINSVMDESKKSLDSAIGRINKKKVTE